MQQQIYCRRQIRQQRHCYLRRRLDSLVPRGHFAFCAMVLRGFSRPGVKESFSDAIAHLILAFHAR
jgi:hypothetical protein